MMSDFPICPHFETCSGCSELLSLSAPAVWKEILSFFDPSITPHLHQGNPLHWRYRAKVAVRGKVNHPLIGLFKRASHDVIPIPSCLVHHPHLNQAFERIRLWMCQNALIPYQETTKQGDLRYLQGVVQRETGQVQMTFVLNTKDAQTSKAYQWTRLIKELNEAYPGFWHSLWLNFNDQPTNTILGPKWSLVCGEELLWETFDKIEVCYGPASFGQANLPLFERLLFRLRHLLSPQARVTEFYAGVGVIGLFIASHCQWVRCSEINPHAEGYFEKSKSRLPYELAAKLSFTSSSTQQALSLLEDSTTVIVDPPRKGLDAQFFPALKENATVKQLLYISCGWEAFKRDCLRLCQEEWKVLSVDGYVFFPGSNHIELLVNFERN